MLAAAKSNETSTAVLDYLATLSGDARKIHEAVILNNKTTDETIASLASSTSDGSLLDIIANNQQRLVRFPKIIDAILANSDRSRKLNVAHAKPGRSFLKRKEARSKLLRNCEPEARVPRLSSLRVPT